MSYALISGGRIRASEDERERYVKRIVAGVAVVVVHILIVIVLVTNVVDVRGLRHKAEPQEIVFILPPLHPKTQQTRPIDQVPTARPVEVPSHAITLPQVKPEEHQQGDIMEAIGKDLACGAGSYEHLSQAQREACKRQPWHYKKTPKGVIVLDVPTRTDEPQTGADIDLHTQQTADPCLASGKTHSECIHKTIFGR